MDLLIAPLELVVRVIDRASLFELILLSTLLTPVLVLVHELGHAYAANALTRGPVAVGVGGGARLVSFRLGRIDVALGPWPSLGGSCEYDADRLWRGRHEAWIAAAGPMASAAAALVLLVFALAAGETRATLETVLTVAAMTALLQGVFTGIPMRYGLGSGAAGADSDGLVAWRILTGGVGRQPALTYGRSSPDDPAIRPVFAVLLAVIAVLGFMVGVGFGLGLVALFALGWLLQRSDERAGR